MPIRLSRRQLAAVAFAIAALLVLVASAAGERREQPAAKCTAIVSWLGPVYVKDGKVVGKPPAPVTNCG